MYIHYTFVLIINYYVQKFNAEMQLPEILRKIFYEVKTIFFNLLLHGRIQKLGKIKFLFHYFHQILNVNKLIPN